MKDTSEASSFSRFSYAWLIVAVCTVVVFLVSGARSAFTVFIAPMEEDLGWGRASVSAVTALNLVVYGATQPLAGRFTDAFGAKKVLVGGALLVAVGFGGLFWVSSIWYLSVFYGVVFGIGVSFASLIPTAVLVARWYDRKQGTAQGIVTAARPAGQTVFVPIAAALIVFLGWRSTYLLVGIAMLVAVPLVLWLVRERPQAQGCGVPHRSSAVAPGEARSTSLLRDSTFIALAVGFFFCGFTDQFVAIHLVPFGQAVGISSVTAANAFAVLSAAGVIGSVAGGWLSDLFSDKYMLTLVYGLRVVSFPMLFVVALNDSVLWMFVFAAIFGVTFIANMAPAVGIIRDGYGTAATGRLVGWLLFGHQLGGAAGTYLGGLIYELTHSYTLAFAIMALGALVAVCFTLGIRAPRGHRGLTAGVRRAWRGGG